MSGPAPASPRPTPADIRLSQTCSGFSVAKTTNNNNSSDSKTLSWVAKNWAGAHHHEPWLGGKGGDNEGLLALRPSSPQSCSMACINLAREHPKPQGVLLPQHPSPREYCSHSTQNPRERTLKPNSCAHFPPLIPVPQHTGTLQTNACARMVWTLSSDTQMCHFLPHPAHNQA